MSDIQNIQNIQIIVITCNEERRQIMTDQLTALCLPHTFFQGHTPATSKDYIVDKDPQSPEKDTMICCMRSHASALHHFVTEFPEKQFALIIEDDADLIHNFEIELQRLMLRWKKHEADIDFVSLGYFPSKGKHEARNSDGNLYWNVTSMVWGTQAYIVKRSVAVQMATVLHHPTTKNLRAAFAEYVQRDLSGKQYVNKHPCVQPDALIPIGWKQAVVFPMMVIELPINSTITTTDNHVSMGMWESVFTDGGRTKAEFYSIPTTKIANVLTTVPATVPATLQATVPATKPSAISILKEITQKQILEPTLTISPYSVEKPKKRRLIVCADNRSPYEGTDTHWTYCIMMTDAYSKLIGVDFKFHLLKETERHPAWEKIRIIQKYVDSYDEIMWIDSDATVINRSVNAFDYIKTAPESKWKRDVSKKPILYALSDKPFDETRACSGIFLTDCTDKVAAHAVLNEWWNDIPDKEYETKHPWEQYVWNNVWKNTDKASYIRSADVFSMVERESGQVFFHAIGIYHNARLSIVKKHFYRFLNKKRAKRIGICVRQQNYYTNGCGQNCIFILQSLEALGYEVDLLVNYKADKPDFVSESIQLSYTNINSVQFSDYEAIIFGSELPFQADNDRMKAAGVRRIMFNPCNVVDQFHNENFLYTCRETSVPLQEMTYKDIADEVWIIDSHKESTLTYMEVVNKNKIPVHVVPHIWSPLFLMDKGGKVSLNRPHTGKKVDIVIMEPNMGYCKSGWIPLIICEKLYLDYPEAINQVFFFNTPDSNKTAMGMIHSLEIWKAKKLRTMTRMRITDILSFFSDPSKHGDHLPVFLSHSVNSPLNYAYFDALYAGFPFVHNSRMLQAKELGYYYDGIASAANAIRMVHSTFNLPESVEKARRFLSVQDPYSTASVTAFKEILDRKTKTTLEGIQKAVVINLDHRKDRYDLFKKTYPALSNIVQRTTAVYGKQLTLTPELAHLFRNNTFGWLKGVMGCALSHYRLWQQLSESDVGPYLIFEDDVKCTPDFIEQFNTCIRHMPADTDILYLGGVLPCNRTLYNQVVERVNENVGRIKMRSDTNTRYFHFGAYSYILTKQGARKLIDYIKESGIHQPIDMIMCRRYNTMNLYMSMPLITSVVQEEDPAFINSNYDDIANQNTYDSDIANMKDRFTEEEIRAAPSLQILIVSACDKRKAILERQFKELEIPYPIRYLEAKVLDAEVSDYVPVDATAIERRTILSTRSHIRAVELAGLDTSPEFTLIMEDDIALHKTDFKSTVEQILESYDAKVTPHSGILSLGWIPCNNHSFYTQLLNPTVLNASYMIHQRFTPGTQAYIIKRTIAKKFTPVFKHPTHKALCDAILAQNNPMITKEGQVTVFDDFGTKLLNQCILFPPLVIEQPNTSLIRGTEENLYWKKFFEGREELRNQYWTFRPSEPINVCVSPVSPLNLSDTTRPLLLSYDNKPTDTTHFFIKTLTTNAWEYVLLGKDEVWEGWQTRMNAYRKYLATLPETKIVILSDARDVLCLRGPHAFMEAFRSYKKDIVVSMELLCGGSLDVPDAYKCVQCKPLAHYWAYYNINPKPLRKYVNNGLIAGTAGALRSLLQWGLDNNYTDDQLALGTYVNTFPELVAADTGADLLHTTNFGVNAGIQYIHTQKQDSPSFAELFGRGAFFLHIPGVGGKGQSVLYNSVRKTLEEGACDKQIRIPYNYNEPAWNEVF